MEFKIISHGSDEYKEMVSLRNEVLRKPLGLHFDEEYLEKEKSTILIGCFRKNTMIACCLLRTISDDVIQLQQMAVQPDLQGKHVGTKLVRFAEEHAQKAGYLKLFLHARKTAVGFYQKLGYEILGDEFEEISIPHFMMKKEL